MYIPKQFDEPSADIAFDLIEEIRLGSLITASGELEVSLLPFMVDREAGGRGRLIGHWARANSQWKNLEEKTNVLVTFVSPHTYVSPSWYETAPRAPTWIYAAVQIRGLITIIEDEHQRRDMVVRLCNELEPASTGWKVDSIAAYIDRILPGIVGFHIDITEIRTLLRLAQQNQVTDRERVLAALQSGSAQDRMVAALMERFSFRDTQSSSAAPTAQRKQQAVKKAIHMNTSAAVFRDLSQHELDAQYNIRAQIPDHPEISKRWAAESERVRNALGGNAHLDVAYGEDALQKVDIFTTDRNTAPLLVFIHGGYWRAQDKSEFSYVAETYVAHGINIANINYRLAPRVTMDEIVSDVRASIAFLHKSAPNYGYDPEKIYISGSSAGGHLTAAALLTDWSKYGLQDGAIKGGCALSGLYDLEPIRLCYLNKEIGLNEETSLRNSPVRHLPRRAAHLILSVGGAESPEFHRQQNEFAQAWQRAGLTCSVVSQSGGHHFDMIDRFADPKSDLFRSTVQLMGI